MKLMWIKRLTLAILFVIAVLLGLVEVAKRKFDPEHYRQQITGYIKKEFGMEVDFSRIRYTLTTHLSIKVEAPSAKGEDFVFSASSVEITPSLRALLTGRLVVKRAEIHNPITLLHRFGDGTWNFEKLLPALDSPGGSEGLVPSRVTIINGDITLIDEWAFKDPAQLHLTAVNFDFRRGGLFKKPYANLTARLKGKVRPATVSLELFSRAKPGARTWKDFPLEGRLSLNRVDTENLMPYIKTVLPEQYLDKLFSLELDFSGVPSNELAFDGVISAQPEVSQLRSAGTMDDRRFEVSGSITPENIALDRISIILPEITLAGNLDVSGYGKADPQVRFKLSSPLIEISRLGDLVPPGYMEEPMVKFVQENIKEGAFRLTDVSFDGPYSRFTSLDDPKNLNFISGNIKLEGFSFNHERLDRPIENIHGALSFDGASFIFSGVEARSGKSNLKKLSGRIDDIHTDPTLTVGGEIDVDVRQFHRQLLKKIASPELSEIFAPVSDPGGNMVLDFNITSDLQTAKVTDFSGNLKINNVSFKHALFDMPVKNLKGSVAMDLADIRVDRVSWSAGSSKFEASGSIDNYSKPAYEINMTFKAAGEPKDFAKTRFYNLDFMKGIKGKISAALYLKGNLDGLSFGHTLDLTYAGYEFTEFLTKKKGAPLQINAQGRFSGKNTMILDHMILRTDSSSITVKGKVDDITTFDDYQLDVHVQRFDLADMSGYSPGFYEGGSQGDIKGQFNIVRTKGKNLFNYRLTAAIKDLDLKQLSTAGSPLEEMNLGGHVNGPLEFAGKSGQLPNIGGKINVAGMAAKTVLVQPFYGMDGTFYFKGRDIRFDGVTGNIGKSHGAVSGNVTLEKESVIRLLFVADVLYLNDLFKIENDEKKTGKGKDREKKKKESKIHNQWYMNIKSKRGTIGKIDYEDLATIFTYYKTHYNFGKLDFTSSKGRWHAVGTLDTEGKKRFFDGDLGVTGLDLEGFLQQIWPENSKITGRLDMKGKFSGDGLSWNRARKNFNGQMEYSAKNGRLKEYQAINDMFSIINIAPLFRDRKGDQKGKGLPYNTITGNLSIKDGVGYTEDMELDGDVVRMSIAGDFNFAQSVVDLKIAVKPLTTLDKIVTKIPIVGHLVGGKEKSIIVSYYNLKGDMMEPKAQAITAKSIGRNIFGIFERILGLPGAMLKGGGGNDREDKKPEDGDTSIADDYLEEFTGKGKPPNM